MAIIDRVGDWHSRSTGRYIEKPWTLGSKLRGLFGEEKPPAKVEELIKYSESLEQEMGPEATEDQVVAMGEKLGTVLDAATSEVDKGKVADTEALDKTLEDMETAAFFLSTPRIWPVAKEDEKDAAPVKKRVTEVGQKRSKTRGVQRVPAYTEEDKERLGLADLTPGQRAEFARLRKEYLSDATRRDSVRGAVFLDEVAQLIANVGPDTELAKELTHWQEAMRKRMGIHDEEMALRAGVLAVIDRVGDWHHPRNGEYVEKPWRFDDKLKKLFSEQQQVRVREILELPKGAFREDVYRLRQILRKLKDEPENEGLIDQAWGKVADLRNKWSEADIKSRHSNEESNGELPDFEKVDKTMDDIEEGLEYLETVVTAENIGVPTDGSQFAMEFDKVSLARQGQFATRINVTAFKSALTSLGDTPGAEKAARLGAAGDKTGLNKMLDEKVSRLEKSIQALETFVASFPDDFAQSEKQTANEAVARRREERAAGGQQSQDKREFPPDTRSAAQKSAAAEKAAKTREAGGGEQWRAPKGSPIGGQWIDMPGSAAAKVGSMDVGKQLKSLIDGGRIAEAQKVAEKQLAVMDRALNALYSMKFAANTVAMTASGGTMTETAAVKAKWEGPLGFEGQFTGDNRYIKPMALDWTNVTFPQPFRWASEDIGAHDGARVIGTIAGIKRLKDGTIWGFGTFDMESDLGKDAQRHVANHLSNGVSLDLDRISAEVSDPSQLATEIENMADAVQDMNITTIKSARTRSATLVALPAFEGARIEVCSQWKHEKQEAAVEKMRARVFSINESRREKQKAASNRVEAIQQAKQEKGEKTEEELSMKTSKVGAFVSIDAGGQWHATIPKKGNRWIDMPGAALDKLNALVKSVQDRGEGDRDQNEAGREAKYLEGRSAGIKKQLESGDIQGAQEGVQAILDNVDISAYSGEGTAWDKDDSGKEIRIDPAEQIGEALQAFVDIDPEEFKEKAAEGEEAGVSTENNDAAGSDEDLPSNPKDAKKHLQDYLADFLDDIAENGYADTAIYRELRELKRTPMEEWPDVLDALEGMKMTPDMKRWMKEFVDEADKVANKVGFWKPASPSAEDGPETGGGDSNDEGLPGNFDPTKTDPKSLTDAQLQEAITLAKAQMEAAPNAPAAEMAKIWGPYFQEQHDRGLTGDSGKPETGGDSDDDELEAEAEADDAEHKGAETDYEDLSDSDLDALYRRYHDDGGSTKNKDYSNFLVTEMDKIAKEKSRRAKETALKGLGAAPTRDELGAMSLEDLDKLRKQAVKDWMAAADKVKAAKAGSPKKHELEQLSTELFTRMERARSVYLAKLSITEAEEALQRAKRLIKPEGKTSRVTQGVIKRALAVLTKKDPNNPMIAEIQQALTGEGNGKPEEKLSLTRPLTEDRTSGQAKKGFTIRIPVKKRK